MKTLLSSFSFANGVFIYHRSDCKRLMRIEGGIFCKRQKISPVWRNNRNVTVGKLSEYLLHEHGRTTRCRVRGVLSNVVIDADVSNNFYIHTERLSYTDDTRRAIFFQDKSKTFFRISHPISCRFSG